MDLTNPARRLYEILEAVDSRWNQNRGQRGQEVLRLVFDDRTDILTFRADDAAFLQFLAALSRLPWEVITALEVTRSRELDWARDHLEFFQQNLGTNALHISGEQARSWLNPTSLLALRACSVALDHSPMWSERVLPKSVLTALVSAVRQTRDLVMSDDELPPVLRDYLLSTLLDIEAAVVQYRVNGIRGLQEVLARIAGSSALDPHLVEQGRSSQGRKAWKSLMVGVLAVYSFAADTVTFAQLDGLPWSGETPPQVIVQCL